MLDVNRRLGRKAQDLAIQLIRIPSTNPPGDVSTCAAALASILIDAGVPTEIVEKAPGKANVVARVKGSGNGRTILFNGHIDVVPATDGWAVDPFEGLVTDGRLIGRGAVDMKSGVAAMAAAVMELRERGLPKRGEVILTAVADEETGSENGTQLLLNQGVHADFAVVGEPTRLDLCIGNRGAFWATVVFKGRASHAGRPHLGANAISAASEFVRLIDTMRFNAKDERFEVDSPSISATMISGGVKINVIPDVAQVSVDRRTLPGESEEQVRAEMEQVLRVVEKRGVHTELRLQQRWKAYAVSEESPPALAVSQACQKVLKKAPRVFGKAAATDASFLFHSGIPTVIFGPGDAQYAHTSEEWVQLDEIATAAEIYLNVAELLTKS
jgi:acetylornithine deacetylase/succinyl-diaminopimelate desuccinylase family protein